MPKISINRTINDDSLMYHEITSTAVYPVIDTLHEQQEITESLSKEIKKLNLQIKKLKCKQWKNKV